MSIIRSTLDSRPARLEVSQAGPLPLNDLEERAWLHQPTRAELLDRILARDQVIIILAMFLTLAVLALLFAIY